VREDGKIRNLVIEVGRERFADRDRTEGRIEQILDELRRDRERNDRRWEENSGCTDAMKICRYDLYSPLETCLKTNPLLVISSAARNPSLKSTG